MIETMKKITITGPLDDFDRIVLKYLYTHKIEYINPQLLLSQTENASLIHVENPYASDLHLACSLLSYINPQQDDIKLIGIDEAIHLVHTLSNKVHHYTKAIEAAASRQERLQSEHADIENTEYETLNQNIQELERNLLSFVYAKRLEILSAHHTIELYSRCFDLRQYAICISHNGFAPLYQLQGYLPESENGHLFHDLHVDRRVDVTLENCRVTQSDVPTKLNDRYFIRGYKHLIMKHHVPPYPLPDLSLTILFFYLLIFGLLFGNIPLSLILILGGVLVSRTSFQQYGHILILCGGSCLIFGVIFYQTKNVSSFFALLLAAICGLIGVTTALIYTKSQQPEHRFPITLQPLLNYLVYVLLFLFLGVILERYEAQTHILGWLVLFLLILCCIIYTISPGHTGWTTILLYSVFQGFMFYIVKSLLFRVTGWYLASAIYLLATALLLCLLIYVQLVCLRHDALFYRFTKDSGHLFQPYTYHSRYVRSYR